jgi:hypothetical protein
MPREPCAAYRGTTDSAALKPVAQFGKSRFAIPYETAAVR